MKLWPRVWCLVFLNHGVYYTGSWDWEPLILPHTGCGIIVVPTAHATVVGGIARSLCKTTSCASGWCEDASFFIIMQRLTRPVSAIRMANRRRSSSAENRGHAEGTEEQTHTQTSLLYTVNYKRLHHHHFLQCFDAVGWAAGRASGL